MIELDLTASDLARLRFGFSPVWETVISLRTLRTAGRHGLHLPWVRSVRADAGGGALAGVDLPLLTAVVPADGYIPDFLTPSLPRRVQSFGAGLEAIAATPLATVAEELWMLNSSSPLVSEMVMRPEWALSRLTTELERYWTAAIEPYWPRIRALHQADLEYRQHQLTSGGVEQMLRSLHPMIDFDGRRLTVRKPYCGLAPLEGRGLMLVPCAFAWPTAMVLTKTPHLPTVTYSPRGVGLLWDSPDLPVQSPLGDLIGRTRAAIVAQLDLPMTTKQLACQLDLSPPTLSEHLQILKTTGIVTSRRDGRAVLYQRTSLGTRLLSGSRPQPLARAQ